MAAEETDTLAILDEIIRNQISIHTPTQGVTSKITYFH